MRSKIYRWRNEWK